MDTLQIIFKREFYKNTYKRDYFSILDLTAILGPMNKCDLPPATSTLDNQVS